MKKLFIVISVLLINIYSVFADVDVMRGNYVIIDVSGGANATNYPVTYHSNIVIDVNNQSYMSDKIVLRMIPPGTFIMGSPTNELGRGEYQDNQEPQHQVTLTAPYYIGIYEITKAQWNNVMNSYELNFREKILPMSRVSYNDIRGNLLGTRWPKNNQVDAKVLWENCVQKPA